MLSFSDITIYLLSIEATVCLVITPVFTIISTWMIIQLCRALGKKSQKRGFWSLPDEVYIGTDFLAMHV